MRAAAAMGGAPGAIPAMSRGTKRCRGCNRTRPLEFFWRGGRDPRCKICRTRYMRRWIASHHDAFTAWQRAYKQRNRELIRAYHRKYQRRRRALIRAGKWKVGRRRAGSP